MTESEKKELTMKMGIIGDYMNSINQYKADYKETVNKILSDTTRTSEFKNEQIAYYKQKLNENVLSTREKVKETIREVRGFVGKPFDLSQSYANTLDYLSTMNKAKALNPLMLENIIEEYRGNEAVLLYLRTKAAEMGIPTYQFDENMFSAYETDVNGSKAFISPTVFFDDLEKTIDRGNSSLIAYALQKMEKVLGVSSVGVSNYISSISEEKERPAVI